MRIVGLPNVGKSLSSRADAAAARRRLSIVLHDRANVGSRGPDPRLDLLAKSQKREDFATRLTFVDIAGLVRSLQG